MTVFSQKACNLGKNDAQAMFFVSFTNKHTTSRKVVGNGVSISKREKCTLSKTEDLADLLTWLHKRIEEKGFDVWKVYLLARPSLVSVLSRMLARLYRLIHLLSIHFSRLDMLTPNWKWV